MPPTGHTFEFIFAPIGKPDLRANDQVSDGPRSKDLVWSRQRRNAGTDVDRHAADVAATTLDLSSMKSDAYLDSKALRATTDRTCTLNGSSRSVERRQEPVTGRLDFVSSECSKFTTHHRVMGIETIMPGSISVLCGKAGGTHDVREHNGREIPVVDRYWTRPYERFLDCVEDQARVLRLGRRVLTGDFNESSSWDVFGQKASRSNGRHKKVAPMKDERGDPYHW